MPGESSCRGFQENIILAVKSCFYEHEIRCLLINGGEDGVVYHNRNCTLKLRTVDEKSSKVSNLCRDWFNSLVHSDENDDGHELPETDLPVPPQDITQAKIDITDEEELYSPEKKHTAKHSNQKSDKIEIKCEFCDKSFVLKSSLDKHQRRQHHELKKLKKISRNGLHKCAVCGLGFDKKPSLHRHMTRSHSMKTGMLVRGTQESDLPGSASKIKKRALPSKQTPCDICGLSVKCLSEHVKRQHNTNQRDPKPFVCEMCGASFKGLSGYQFHVSGHTGEKKYSCELCGKQFRSLTDSYNCERGHKGIFKWRCSQCPFKSHQKNKYVRHLRVHTKSQPFSCPLCGHKTARKDYLQKHIKRFHCNVSLSLEELEKVYPHMYNIEEILDVKPTFRYSRLQENKESEGGQNKILHLNQPNEKYEQNVQRSEPVLKDKPEVEYQAAAAGYHVARKRTVFFSETVLLEPPPPPSYGKLMTHKHENQGPAHSNPVSARRVIYADVPLDDGDLAIDLHKPTYPNQSNN